MRPGPERKTRKSAVPTLIKKTVLDSRGRVSRIENSSARLLVSHGDPRGSLLSSGDSNRNENSSLLNNTESETQIDIDEPLHTPTPPLDSLVTQEPISTSTNNSTTVPFGNASAPFAEETLTLNVDKAQTQGSNEHPATTSPSISDQPQVQSSVQVQVNNNPELTANTPQTSASTTDEHIFSGPPVSAAATLTAASSSSSAPTHVPGSSPTSASTSQTLTATAAASTPSSPALFSSCIPVSATPNPSSTPSKAADPSSMVSLKIIISDTQDEDSSSDAALNQAISSISGEKIPTIYMSSPAKSPRCPPTPKDNFDEAAQAVSGLQSSEVYGSPLGCRATAVCTTPLSGTGQNPQRYFIQVPADPTNPGLQGSAPSYFFVTPTVDVQARQMLLPAGVSSGQPGATTPTQSQNYTGEMEMTVRQQG